MCPIYFYPKSSLWSKDIQKLWDIPTPQFSIVNISPEHLPTKFHNNRIYPGLFKKPCFGTKRLTYAQDITDFLKVTISNNYLRGKIVNISDYFKVALFDIWLANEDRHIGNTNLLLNPTDQGNVITAIDHSDIFNTNNLKNGLAQLTFEDSILMSDFTKLLIDNQHNPNDIIKKLEKEYYLCIRKCGENVQKIVESTPGEWGLNSKNVTLQVKAAIIDNDEWLKESLTNFKQYLLQAIR